MFPFHIVRCTGKKTTISRVSTSLYVKSNCDRLFAAVELVFGVVHPGYSECLSWTGTYTKREKREQNFKYFSSTETSVLYTDFKHVSLRKSGFKGARTRRCILKSRLCLFRYTTQYNSFTFVWESEKRVKKITMRGGQRELFSQMCARGDRLSRGDSVGRALCLLSLAHWNFMPIRPQFIMKGSYFQEEHAMVSVRSS